MLKTSSGRGYRLLGSWTVRHGGASEVTPPVPPPRDQPEERPPTNLPVTIAKLIGRTTAVQRVRDLVSAYRVVTLTGAGGIGKTALAMKVGHRLLADFEHGAWLVELASLSDAALAPSAVAGALGLKLVGEQTTAESLARAVGDRHLLLVLDNCEHLIDAVATLVETVMQLCPRAIGSGDQPRGHADSGRGRLPRSGARRPRSWARDTRQRPRLQRCRAVRHPGEGTGRGLLGTARGSPVDRRDLPAARRHSARHRVRRGPRRVRREPSRSPPACAIALRC